MRTNAADQHVVAVVQQVVRGDGGADVGACRLDELHGVTGGDVLEHHFQGWEARGDATQLLVDEVFLTIEDIDLAARDLAVDQQRQADLRHGFQHAEDVVDGGHAGSGVGGRACRI